MSERLSQLMRLHEADPADPFCAYGIALEYAKQGRSDEAIVWLDKTLSIDPRYCYAYYQKAKVYLSRGDDAPARAALSAGMQAAAAANDAHAQSEIAELLASLE